MLLWIGLCGCAAEAPLHPRHPPLVLEGQWVEARAGETAAELARRHEVPLDDVTELNDVDPEAPLEPGRRVFIPGKRRRRAAEAAARAPGRAPGARARATHRMSWPVAGPVTSRFGRRWGRMHEGIDILAAHGTPVRAAAAGEVVYSDNKLRGFGNLVILLHEGGFLTVYAHNAQNLVKERTYVNRGQPIATVGSTGHSTAPHLHFEVRLGDVPQDPEEYLEER